MEGMQVRRRNPWKGLALAVAFALPMLLMAGTVLGMLEDDRRVEQNASVVVVDSGPPASVVYECNRTAELEDTSDDATGSGSESVRTPDVAANFDPAAASRVARRPGTIVGMSEQNSRNAAARAAFRDCMLRKGYAS